MQLVEAPGEAKPDWWIFSRVAQQMGFSGFDFDSNEPIWDEFRGLTQGRPCDMSGMTNERLKAGPLQWPCPSEDHPGTARRYTDRKFGHPDGKAQFIACKHKAPREFGAVDSTFPLTLTTGRLASQWHTMTRTGKIAKLAGQATTPYIEMHPDDAKRYEIIEGDTVLVESVRGQAQVQAKFNDRIKKGVVFMPFHWGSLYAPGAEANNLTNHEFDPISKQPEFKACAVRLQKAV
jgi:ferredoxin-nitrate reductase